MDKTFYKNMKKFASKDMSRPMMNYICFNGEYAVATSPYALARLKCEQEPHYEKVDGTNAIIDGDFPKFEFLFDDKENVVYTVHLVESQILEMGKVFKIAANSIPDPNKTLCINKQGECLYFVFSIGSMMAKVRVLDDLDDDGNFTEFVNAKFMNNIFSFMHDMNIKGSKWTIKKKKSLNTFVSGELDFAMSGIRVREETEKKYMEVF